MLGQFSIVYYEHDCLMMTHQTGSESALYYSTPMKKVKTTRIIDHRLHKYKNNNDQTIEHRKALQMGGCRQHHA